MKNHDAKLKADKNNYVLITRILYASFALNACIVILLNIGCIEKKLDELLGILSIIIIQQFFVGAIGATISSSLFLSKDQEINAIESNKENPNPEILRYPNVVDANLYVQRIITSGFLAILGVFVLLAGYSYLDVDYKDISTKHLILFYISSMLIGMFQKKFLRYLSQIFDKIYKRDKDDKSPPKNITSSDDINNIII